MTLGQVIRHYRRERKLTQAQLAERIQRNQSLLSRWESDERAPSLDDVRVIARELSIPLSALVEGIAHGDDSSPIRAEG